jgi:hypothetical protein
VQAAAVVAAVVDPVAAVVASVLAGTAMAASRLLRVRAPDASQSRSFMSWTSIVGPGLPVEPPVSGRRCGQAAAAMYAGPVGRVRVV